jgi:hypothetical protein
LTLGKVVKVQRGFFHRGLSAPVLVLDQILQIRVIGRGGALSSTTLRHFVSNLIKERLYANTKCSANTCNRRISND